MKPKKVQKPKVTDAELNRLRAKRDALQKELERRQLQKKLKELEKRKKQLENDTKTTQNTNQKKKSYKKTKIVRKKQAIKRPTYTNVRFGLMYDIINKVVREKKISINELIRLNPSESQALTNRAINELVEKGILTRKKDSFVLSDQSKRFVRDTRNRLNLPQTILESEFKIKSNTSSKRPIKKSTTNQRRLGKIRRNIPINEEVGVTNKSIDMLERAYSKLDPKFKRSSETSANKLSEMGINIPYRKIVKFVNIKRRN
jgi:multidrug efflux pump subunit AcrA (membrane-fusion protein)